ncbi:hypothetical protein LSH36_320g01002 [Paralvinella palmiformis]|uniref:HAUS augmin-like complex subunit 2 n=1 Tax=Paralvinella palmiformis TaxID=53620 RepID=A0AAD9JGW1_9ANNE|nr:hypothetical protein LSH36_320g01002 [Paralvinella palmiformis]
MDQSSSLTRNPWADDERSFGRIRSVLRLAGKHNYLHEDDCESSEDVVSRSKCRSLILINILSDMEKQKIAINKVDLEIQKRLLVKETKDLTDVKTLEQRIELITELSTHLQSVITKKERLLGRLQQPHTGDYLKIDASYRIYAHKVIPQLVPVLSELSEQLDNIEWAAQVSVFDTQINSLLSDITRLLATIHVNVRSMLHMRDMVQQIRSQRLKHAEGDSSSQ